MVAIKNFKRCENRVEIENMVVRVKPDFTLAVVEKRIKALMLNNQDKVIFMSEDAISLLLNQDFLHYLETQEKPDGFDLENFINGIIKSIRYPASCLIYCKTIDELKDIVWQDDLDYYFKKSISRGSIDEQEVKKYQAIRGV